MKKKFVPTRSSLCVFLMLFSGWAQSSEIAPKTVKPIIVFITDVAGEFGDAQSAFNATKAVRDTVTPYVTHTMINFRPEDPQYNYRINGIPHYYVSDSFSCFPDGSNPCYTTERGGPTVTALVPRCPEQKFLVDGVMWSYALKEEWTDSENIKYWCERKLPENEPCPNGCGEGNPILPSTGEKIQPEVDYSGGQGLSFRRMYRSTLGQFSSQLNSYVRDHQRGADEDSGCFLGSYTERTSERARRITCYKAIPQGGPTVDLWTAEGRRIEFTGGIAFVPTRPGTNESLEKLGAGDVAWLVKRETGEINGYGPDGRPKLSVMMNGLSKVTFRYSDASTPASIAPAAGYVIAAVDLGGRELTFTYDAQGLLTKMMDASGGQFRYGYDAGGALTSVEYPDLSQRKYFYGEATHINGGTSCGASEHTYGRLLTGIQDENGVRFADFRYDCGGRALSTEHAGGVDKFTVAYGSGSASVTGPLGTQRTRSFATLHQLVRDAGTSQPAGAGSSASASQIVYDPVTGNVMSRNGFNGARTCYAYDTRNLETVRVEGLGAGAACSVTAVNAVLPADSRKVSKQWHPDWRLETKVTEPGRITTSVYNGQPDPLNGNAIASCAPTTALLPDGKPIAVLCKRVEQATTDANGAAGFSATLQAGVVARTWKWTYNEYGQVLTEDGPRTDVTDVTTYTYYTDTTADHTKGDLQQVTNAVGKVTQYTKYNKHGQVLESVDPNGVQTVNTYDLRQRLLSTAVGGQMTSYTYDPVGQLKRVTLPDTTYVGYDYDDAHRMISVYDHLGNRTTYELDNAGNRTSEKTTDPTNQLKRQLGRSIDALGRVQQMTGRE